MAPNDNKSGKNRREKSRALSVRESTVKSVGFARVVRIIRMEPRETRDTFRKTIIVSAATVLGTTMATDLIRWGKELAVLLWVHITIRWTP